MKKEELGKIVLTPGVCDEMKIDEKFEQFVLESLNKYINNDWGDTSEEDKQTNDLAYKNGDRILAVYKKDGLPKIWIITEWDRSVTTVLFPEEY